MAVKGVGHFFKGVGIMPVVRIGVGDILSFGLTNRPIPGLINGFALLRFDVFDIIVFFLELSDDL